MSESLSRAPTDHVARDLIFVACVVLLGILALVLGRGSGGVRLSPSDPGPWAVPHAAAWILIGCGVWELVFVAAPRLRPRRPDVSTEATPGSAAREPADDSGLSLADWGVVAGIGTYVLVLPYLGFTLGTLVSVPLFVKRQGLRWPWWVALGGTLLLVMFIKSLFGGIFGVLMPEGLLSAYL